MEPFVKWAGGKRQLLSRIHERMPETYSNYYEPFIGGGAVLLDLEPLNATINDINEHLVFTYKTIRDNVDELMKFIDKLVDEYNNSEDKKSTYYSFREKYNSKIENKILDIETASLFIVLNKTCFNGLYRVNSKGLFNVPHNGRKKLKAYDKDNLIKISEYLNEVNLLVGDFEVACQKVKKGDFVFFDSPYAPLNPTSFESYTKEGFSKEEHERLARLFKDLSDRGAYCMLTNHNTDFINELYHDYNIEVVPVKRMINSDSSNRVGEEVIITNY